MCGGASQRGPSSLQTVNETGCWRTPWDMRARGSQNMQKLLNTFFKTFVFFEIIITLIPSTFPFPTLPYSPPCSPPNSWLLFPLIIVKCIFVYVCTYIFLYITYSIYVLLVCVFRSLGTRQPIGMRFPEEDKLSRS